jgi:hypothetical protein
VVADIGCKSYLAFDVDSAKGCCTALFEQGGAFFYPHSELSLRIVAREFFYNILGTAFFKELAALVVVFETQFVGKEAKSHFYIPAFVSGARENLAGTHTL